MIAPGVSALDGPQLAAFTADLARREELWREHVAHDAGQRVYTEIVRTAAVSAWLICWCNEQDTGFHDHDVSAGAVAVIAGQICEERLRTRLPPRRRSFGAGDCFHFEACDIHRVRHVGDEPAVTLHAYSPPLLRMGAYVVEAAGRLRRRSVPLTESLRPLKAA